MWKLSNGEVLGLFSETSLNLVDIHKGIACICARYNNWARKYPRVEPFTNVQPSQVCHSHYFLKISCVRVAHCFDLGKDIVLQDWNVPYHVPYNSPAPGVQIGDRIFDCRILWDLQVRVNGDQQRTITIFIKKMQNIWLLQSNPNNMHPTQH